MVIMTKKILTEAILTTITTMVTIIMTGMTIIMMTNMVTVMNLITVMNVITRSLVQPVDLNNKTSQQILFQKFSLRRH